MPKVVDHNERKAVIAKATYQVIRQVGLENTTIRKIAEQSGLSMGSVQYYFPKQHDLYLYAVQLIMRRVEARIASIVESEMPLENKVLSMMKQVIPHSDEEIRVEAEVWLAFSLMALRNPALRELNEQVRLSLRKMITDILRHLERVQMLKPSLDIDAEARNLHAFIDGVTLHAILYPESFQGTRIETYLTDYLRHLRRDGEWLPPNVDH